MKILNEKEVEKAVEMFAGNQRTGYRMGVLYAEKQIEPIMIDFALWWHKNVRYSDIPHHYLIIGKYSVCYKKEQLLEQFINQRK